MLEIANCHLSTNGTKGQPMNIFDPCGIDDIDAIAYGVEAWFEENTGYSKGVAETTVEIARKLGVPEDEIRRWAARQSTLNTEKVKLIKSLLQRVGASSPGGGLKTGNTKRGNPG